MRTIRVFGPRDLAQQLADEMELRLEALGLKVEVVTHYAPKQFGLQLPGDAPVSPALAWLRPPWPGASRFLISSRHG